MLISSRASADPGPARPLRPAIRRSARFLRASSSAASPS